MYVFSWIVICSILLWVATYESLLYLIPIATSILWAFSFFFLEKIQLRISILIASFSWLYFHINIWSIWWMVTEFLTEFILIITILRMAGHEWYLHHYREVVSDIVHKHRHVDLWTMVVVKDTNKIIKKEGYFHKILANFKARQSFKLEK